MFLAPPATLKCEYPLPLSVEQKSSVDVIWEECEFLTTSLGGEEYTIEEDGQIYELIFETHVDEAKGTFRRIQKEINKLDLTGEIKFNLLYPLKKEDLWVEIVAWVREGDVKEIHLLEWKKSDNAPRKEHQAQVEKLLKKEIKQYKKWWFFLYKIYFTILSLFYEITKGFLLKMLQGLVWVYRKLH